MILVDIKKLINDYLECNNFEIKYIDGKVKIYYYDDIENFTSDCIEIKYDDKNLKVKGKNLVIETMFKEYLIISGDIRFIEFS